MAIPQNKQVLLRSMRAKLSALQRPVGWGSATVVLLASYVGFGYLTHPERLRFSGSTGVENGETALASPTDSINAAPTNEAEGDRPPLPSEDNNIGIDIDSLLLLFDDIQSASGAIAPEAGTETDSTAALSENTEATQSNSGSSLSFNTPYDLLSRDDSNAVARDSSITSNSFYSRLFSGSSQSPVNVAPSRSDLQGSRASASESLLPSSALGFSASGSTTSASSVVSPLQQSIEQRFESSNSSSLDTTLPNAAPVGTAPLRSEFTSNSIYPGVVSSPSPGTTGYTPPAALRSPTNPYTRLTNPSFINPTTAGVSPVPSGFSSGVPVPQSAPYQSTPYTTGYPSSVPGATSYPGAVFPNQVTPSGTSASPNGQPTSSTQSNPNRRYTGGGRNGEINTFSNP